jgi:viologen exporter family transport system permease protein
MRTFRVGWFFFRVGAMNELQYRANFFVQLFKSLLSLGVALIVLRLVYSHTAELNGWSQSELLIVLGIQLVMAGIVHTAIQPNMQRFVEEVQDGKLDYALTKPEDAQVIVSVREVQIWQLVDVVSGSIVIGVGIAGLDHAVTVGDLIAFAGLLAVGAVLIYCFWLIIATGAFWIIRMWFIAELFEGVFATGRWPIGIYPGWLKYSLTYLVPIGFAITVPAEAVTSRLGWTTVVVALAFAAALFTFTRWFWTFGLRQYSGASA